MKFWCGFFTAIALVVGCYLLHDFVKVHVPPKEITSKIEKRCEIIVSHCPSLEQPSSLYGSAIGDGKGRVLMLNFKEYIDYERASEVMTDVANMTFKFQNSLREDRQ